MKLSVIIPVYQAERTIDRCMRSVLDQHVEEMEIVVIDDGSTDGSGLRCDAWAQQDKRICVVHQQNQGLSAARNAGLNIAQGKYVTFVDSDDWVESDSYPTLIATLDAQPTCDILEYSYEKGGIMHLFEERRYDTSDDYLLKGEAYRHSFSWNKIFRRRLFDTVRFPKDRVFEDMYVLPDLLRQARHVFTVQHGLYHYTVNPNGITMKADGTQTAQLLEGFIRLMESISKHYDTKELQAMYLQALDIQLETHAKHGPLLLQPYTGRLCCRDSYTWRSNVKIMLYNTIGIKPLCKVYNILNRLLLHRS